MVFDEHPDIVVANFGLYGDFCIFVAEFQCIHEQVRKYDFALIGIENDVFDLVVQFVTDVDTFVFEFVSEVFGDVSNPFVERVLLQV